MKPKHENFKQGTVTGLEGGIAPNTGVEGKSRQADLDPTSSGSVSVGLASAQAERGESNTPAAKPINIQLETQKRGVATSIDWLKVRFDGKFQPSNDPNWAYKPIFDALKIDPTFYQERRGVTGYARGYQYDMHINVFAGGPKTLSKDGEETWVLELTGQGCREFERNIINRGGEGGKPLLAVVPGCEFEEEARKAVFNGWKKLIDACLFCAGKCTRIDLPTDDLDDNVPFDTLKEKIAAHAFTSSFRSIKIDKTAIPKESDEEGFDTLAHYQTSVKGGWTATLGTRESFQICIYDKKAEMETHHPDWGKICDHWVRFEVRFYHKQAANILWQLHEAYKLGEMGVHRFIVGCLASLLDVKDRAERIGHRGRIKTWDKWEEFIRNGKEFKKLPPTRNHDVLKSNALWIKNDTVRAFFRIAAVYPNHLRDIVGYILLNGMTRADNSDLFIINDFLSHHGMEPYPELVEAQKRVFKEIGFDESDIDDNILALFDSRLVPATTDGGTN